MYESSNVCIQGRMQREGLRWTHTPSPLRDSTFAPTKGCPFGIVL